MKTFELIADITGQCEIVVKASSKEEAIKKLKKCNWDICGILDWDISDWDLDSVEEIKNE